MSIKIALAGNPNCGKTTLFNNLTGSNQYVGNWPGVTVEKKEGKLKGEKDVIIQDLPGIYSLSPYTLEEVVSRTYLVKEKPDAILNIIDGTNIERNLYLTTQLIELGIPVVMAVNMIDLVRKNGDTIDLKKLSAELGCQAVEISALKGEGTEAAAKAAVAAAKAAKTGFEWPDVHAALDKVDEETRELRAAVASGDTEAIGDELGDLLFAAVKVARFAGIDPEQAAHAACEKFIRRFSAMETAAANDGTALEQCTLEQMLTLWQQAKQTVSAEQESRKSARQ